MCSGSYICPACTAYLYPTNKSKDITPLLKQNWLTLKFLANSKCSVQHSVEMKRRSIGPSPQHLYFVPHFPLLICFSSLVQQSSKGQCDLISLWLARSTPFSGNCALHCKQPIMDTTLD